MRFLTFLFCCFLVFPALTYGSDDLPRTESVIVQDGDSLSKLLLLQNDGNEERVLEMVKALKDLQDTEGGVQMLKSFGIVSGNAAKLYPGDEINVGAIHAWFDGGQSDVSAEGQSDPTSDQEVVADDTPITLVPVPDSVTFVETEEEEGAEDQDPSVVAEGGGSDGILPEEVMLGEDTHESTSPNVADEGESELVQQITDIAEESRSDEVGSGFDASCAFAYASDGIDTMLLEHFFRGHVVSQELSVSHSSGLHIAITNLTSIEGGAFSDLGDRTNLSIGLQRNFGSFYGSIGHQWVHTNHLMSQNFFYADRHRTSLQVGRSQGILQPYAFVLSDVPAYTPVDEMMIYGGVGVTLSLPVDALNTNIEIGTSFVGSLLWYYRDRQALYRVYAGIKTHIGALSVHPEISRVADAFTGESIITTSFKFTF